MVYLQPLVFGNGKGGCGQDLKGITQSQFGLEERNKAEIYSCMAPFLSAKDSQRTALSILAFVRH